MGDPRGGRAGSRNREEADAAIATAISLYEQKGNVAAAERLRATAQASVNMTAKDAAVMTAPASRRRPSR
jgi:hypothetical protein